jgi:hypothetical protein
MTTSTPSIAISTPLTTTATTTTTLNSQKTKETVSQMQKAKCRSGIDKQPSIATNNKIEVRDESFLFV